MFRIGLKSGVYTLLTPGHIKSFEFMKTECDHLVIFINDDEYLKKKKGYIPISAQHRAFILQHIKEIDEVHIYSGQNEHEAVREYLKDDNWDDCDRTITMFHNPEFLHRKFVPGEGLVDRIVYTPFWTEYDSTTDIINKIQKK